MDVDIAKVLERTKRCAMIGRKRAEERGNHNVKQQMEEIEALLDILETKIKERYEEIEAATKAMAD